MAAVSAERDSAKMFRGSESCSVCLDAVSDSGERSIAKLKCGHHFHLDCIGSAFNAKGAMQCPNCRHVENGQWLYANGSRWNDDFPFEEISYEDDYEVYQTTLSPFLTHRAEALNHFEFCPYGHLGLTSGGSSYEPFQMAMLRDIDVPVSRIRSGPEVVVNVSYNYPDGGIASVPTPLSPYHDGQARQSQGAEESRLRQPVPPVGSTRPLDPSGASNSGSSIGSFGSLIGDGGDGLNSGRSIWGPYRDRYHQSPFSGYSRTDQTSIFTDQTRFSPTMDRLSPMMDLLSRDRAPFHGDTGSGAVAHERSTSRLLNEAHAFERSNSRLLNEAHAHERSTSRLLNESQRVTNHILGTLSAQHGHNESYVEGFNGQGPQGPCPFRRMHGQVGNSQSQPPSSSFHSATAPIGSSRRSRQNGNGIRASPSTSGGGRNGDNGWELGSIGEPSSRRASQTCPNLSLSLGPEPPVPGLESHGSGYRSGGQGFVPWGRRDNNPSGPSSSPWTPGQLWHPPTIPSPSQPNRFSYSDYLEGHGSSQHGPSQHGSSQHGPAQNPILQDLVDQSSLFSNFGTDPAGVGGSIRNRIPSPTPYSISLRPPSPPVRWCT